MTMVACCQLELAIGETDRNRQAAVHAITAATPPVVDTEHGRVATLVCYDLEFPEWVRIPALAGAELLCVPTNWPRESRPHDERPAEVTRVLASASVNRVFIAACDRAGSERGTGWVNGTVIAGPDGYPLVGPVGEDAAVTVCAECELDAARRKAISPRNDVFADRRPELYERKAADEPLEVTRHARELLARDGDVLARRS